MVNIGISARDNRQHIGAKLCAKIMLVAMYILPIRYGSFDLKLHGLFSAHTDTDTQKIIKT